MPDYVQNCSAPSSNHLGLGPKLPEHSKMRLSPIDRPTLRRERYFVPENAQQRKNHLAPMPKHRENATLWHDPLSAQCRQAAKWFSTGHSPRLNVPACPKIGTKPCKGATPSRYRAPRKAHPARHGNCRSPRRIAPASDSDLPNSIPDFLLPQQPCSTPHAPVGSKIARRYRRGVRVHTLEWFPTFRSGHRIQCGLHAEPNSCP